MSGKQQKSPVKGDGISLDRLEKALVEMGKNVNMDLEDDFLSKAMGQEGEEGEEGEEGAEPESKPAPKPTSKKAPSKKEEDEDEDEDEEGGEDSDEGEEDSDEGEDDDSEYGAEDYDEGTKKSMRSKKRGQDSISKSFQNDPTIQDGVDVSEFLEALVSRSTDGLVYLNKSLRRKTARDEKFQKSLVKVLQPMAQILASMHVRQQRQDEALKKLSGQSTVRKSLSGTAQPLSRPMGVDTGTGNDGTRSATLVKSLADGGPQFSSLGDWTNHIIDRVQKSQNPQEIDALSKLVTQIETRSVSPVLAKALGYEVL